MDRDVSSAAKIAALEQRYIELLERKIEALETANRTLSLQIPENPLSHEAASRANGRSSTVSDPRDLDQELRLIQFVPKPTTKATDDKGLSANGVTPTTSIDDSRIRFRDKRYNAAGLATEVDAAATVTQEEPKRKKNSHAMTVIRHYDELHKYDYSEIIIEDDGLRCLLLHVLAYHPWYCHAETLSFVSSYEALVHSWPTLNALVENDEAHPFVASLHNQLKTDKKSPVLKVIASDNTLDNARNDLKLLLEQIMATPGLDSYFDGGRQVQERTDTVTFDQLWTLFPPGELVFSSVYMRQPQVFIVRSCTDYIRDRRSGRTWTLDCWSYDWNGTSFNRVPVEFVFDNFKGSRSINSLLPCHPLRHHRDEENDIESLKEKLIRRGKIFTRLCLRKRGHQIFEYDGYALSRGAGIRQTMKKSSQDEDYDSRSNNGSINDSRNQNPPELAPKRLNIKKDHVMVDFESYIQHGPPFVAYAPMGDIKFGENDGTCQCATCTANTALKSNQKPHYDGVKITEDFEETQYMICPPRVLGYHLNGKKWMELDVMTVKDIENLTDASSFQKLELNTVQKELIKKLVKSHASGTEKTPFMRDLMKGKGNGLVILLHGPPGVGKTLTAESVAKVTGKPLFSVSVSDIGLKPAEVEHNLEVLFELAATWRAVLLFDEADVFLESRSSNTSSLDRNALVSVLLRVLEYYDGILILTTNRIRTFDIAVQSRVNFAITYKNLDDKQKRNIYVSFIDQLTDDNCKDKQQLRKWLDEEDNVEASPFKRLNGRQIRNVLFSAASVASNEGDGRLKLDHIRKILRETQKFQEDVHNMIEMARKEAEVDYSRNM